MERVAEVQEVLRRWDPIGVMPGELGPADEYDSYAMPIVSLIARGCSTEEVRDYLQEIRTKMIGLPADPVSDRQIADEIMRLWA